MTVPLIQATYPRKTARGWRITLVGFNLDQVLGVTVGDLLMVLPLAKSERELVFTVPSTATPGVYPVVLSGAFGTFQARGLTVVDLPDLDARLPQAYTAEDYTAQLLELLPKGLAWTRRIGTNIRRLLSAAAEELSRVHTLARFLLEEVTPSQTTGSLNEWEEELGLPESCVTSPATDDDSRRREIFRKANSLGGCSPAYFEELAAILGFSVKVDEYFKLAQPFKAGQAVAGDALTQGPWLFTWRAQVLVPDSAVLEFTAGNGTAGTPLRWWGLEELECLFEQLKPAHTLIVFTYVLGVSYAMVGNTGEFMAGNIDQMIGGT